MSFFGWLNTKSNLEAPPAPGREFGPEKDDWQRDLPPGALNPVDANRDGVPDAIAGLCLSIDYVDASAARSSRRILVDDLYSGGGYCYIEAFCLLRQDQRTFRADRIEFLRIPPDWREVANPLSFLMGYLPASNSRQIGNDKWDSYAQAAERYGRLYNGRKAANHGLRVLAFVSRSDGKISDEERSVVCSYVRGAAALVGEKLNEDECREIASDIDTLFPTKRQVTNSLNAIRMYYEQSDIFMNSLKLLVRADGVIDEQEREAVQMLVEILHRQRKRDNLRRS